MPMRSAKLHSVISAMEKLSRVNLADPMCITTQKSQGFQFSQKPLLEVVVHRVRSDEYL